MAKRMQKGVYWRGFIAAVCCAALAGCAVGPDFRPPAAPAMQNYTATALPAQSAEAPGAGGNAQRFDIGAKIPEQWWTLFRSVDLDRLIRLALADNPTTAAAQAALRQTGSPKREAVESAAAIRLRPILMTTAAMVLGVLPLVLATGAGAVGRFNMGLVIMTGIAIGTLFTLFVVPAMYMLLAQEHAQRRQTAESTANAPSRA